MVEAVGKNSDQKPFAGELRDLRKIELNSPAEAGAAANILVTGIDHNRRFLNTLQKSAELLFVPDSETGGVIDPGSLKKMVMRGDDKLFAAVQNPFNRSSIFREQRAI